MIDLTPPWYPLFNSHQYTSRSPSSCNQTSQPYFPQFNGHNTVQPQSMGDYLTALLFQQKKLLCQQCSIASMLFDPVITKKVGLACYSERKGRLHFQPSPLSFHILGRALLFKCYSGGEEVMYVILKDFYATMFFNCEIDVTHFLPLSIDPPYHWA